MQQLSKELAQLLTKELARDARLSRRRVKRRDRIESDKRRDKRRDRIEQQISTHVTCNNGHYPTDTTQSIFNAWEAQHKQLLTATAVAVQPNILSNEY